MRPDCAERFAFCDLHATRIPALRATGWLGAQLGLQMGSLYYDRQGFPIGNVLDWARLMEDLEYKVVAQDELPDGSHLSTVWLGIAHGYGRPLFFETMRFPAESAAELPFPDPSDGEETTQLRSGSEEEARAAHHEILRRLRVRLGS